MSEPSLEGNKPQEPQGSPVSQEIQGSIERLQNQPPENLVDVIQDSINEITKASADLKVEKDKVPTLKRLTLALAPITLAVSALVFRTQAENHTPDVHIPPPTPTATKHEPQPPPVHEIGPASTVYNIQEEDSISSILAKMHPEKYLDENGHFKTDDATQEALYREIYPILIANRQILQQDNRTLYQAIDSATFNLEIGTTLSGLELKKIVQEIGGPHEVVVIRPGQQLQINTGDSTAEPIPKIPQTPKLQPITPPAQEATPPPFPTPVRHTPPAGSQDSPEEIA